jgi:CheY-like chemotaxis protein
MTGDELQGRSVLVIDDDPDTLELYAVSLAKLGADVRRARNADGAFAVLHAWRPDIVLCDLHLPDVDGYDVLAGIRADPWLMRMPVIAITGSHPTVEQERSQRAGFARCLTKPARMRELVDAIVALTPQA